jgi:hypothetical protein
VDRTVIETRSDYSGDPQVDAPAHQALSDWQASTHEEQLTPHVQQTSAGEQVTLRVDRMDSQVISRPGLFGWFRRGSRAAVQGDDTTSQQDKDSLLLSPEELIKAAGGPLPPEKRRKCPECGTTVPKQAVRCGWCGMQLSAP